MAWFARRRRRQRYAEVAATYALLRTADEARQAGVTGDPEWEEYVAGLRAKVAEWRANARRDRYPR